MLDRVTTKIATRVFLSRSSSRYIRQAGRIIANELQKILRRSGPVLYNRFEEPTILAEPFNKVLGDGTLKKAATVLREGGINVNWRDLANVDLKIYGSRSNFNPPKMLLTVGWDPDYWSWDDFVGDEFLRTFMHEFVHVVDFLRGNPEGYDRSGLTDREYFTHDLEINALIQQTLDQYERDLLQDVEGVIQNSDDIEWDLMTLLGKTSRQMLEDFAYNNLPSDLYRYMLDDRELKQRIMKRLYTEVEEVKDALRNRVKRETGITVP